MIEDATGAEGLDGLDGGETPAIDDGGVDAIAGAPAAGPAEDSSLREMIGEPVVTAIVVTYNHERYIHDALDSVVSQQTNFPFEIIISEDRSTDGTAAIVESYVERFPDRIRFIRSDVNLRSKEVLFRAMRKARGRYITFLDGDDYWVSLNKLQAQVDFMESNPDSAITYHDVERITDDGEVLRVMRGIGHRGTVADLIQGNFIGTCSVMFRRAMLPDVPAWVNDMPSGDWPLYFLAARSGFIDHVPDIIARYRVHAASYWATRPLAEQVLMGFCMQVEIEAQLGPDYKRLFEESRRATAHHVLTTILNERPEPQAEPSTDVEKQLKQAETAVTTGRVRLVELKNRVNEAEAERSLTEHRFRETLQQLQELQAAEAAQGDVRRRLIETEAVSAYIADRLDKAEHEAKDLIGRAGRFEVEAQHARDRLRIAQAETTDLANRLRNAEAEAQHLTFRLRSSEAEMQNLSYRLGAADSTAEDLTTRLSGAESRGQELQDRLRGSEAEARDLAERLHRGEREAEGRERELQAAIEAANRRTRRIRRREKRIGIALGLLAAILLAIVLATHVW